MRWKRCKRLKKTIKRPREVITIDRSERVDREKISRSAFRFVEHELYLYEATKKEIVKLRADIIEGGSEGNVTGRRSENSTSDITGNKACQLISMHSTASVLHMEKVVQAIEKGLNMLNESHRELFILKYKLHYSTRKICKEMPCSERACYRYRRELVEKVAENMGVK